MKTLKRLLWFLFKAPQRRITGIGSLLTDFRGIGSLILGSKTVGRQEPIWICTGNFNRSRALLDHLITSMSKSPEAGRLGLSVADCMSSDVDGLESAIREIWHGPLVFSQHATQFTRASVFNQAITQSPGNVVFVCDADISLPQDLVQKIEKYLRKGTAWFPVCQWQLTQGSPEWKWFSAGTGLFAADKKQLVKTGMYDPRFEEWGKEDWDLFFRFYKAGIMPLRTRCSGLYHHWHPPSKPEGFVNMF